MASELKKYFAKIRELKKADDFKVANQSSIQLESEILAATSNKKRGAEIENLIKYIKNNTDSVKVEENYVSFLQDREEIFRESGELRKHIKEDLQQSGLLSEEEEKEDDETINTPDEEMDQSEDSADYSKPTAAKKKKSGNLMRGVMKKKTLNKKLKGKKAKSKSSAAIVSNEKEKAAQAGGFDMAFSTTISAKNFVVKSNVASLAGSNAVSQRSRILGLFSEAKISEAAKQFVIIGAAASVQMKRSKMAINAVRTSLPEQNERASKQEALNILDRFCGKTDGFSLSQISVAFIPEILEMRLETFLLGEVEKLKSHNAPQQLAINTEAVLKNVLCGKEAIHLRLGSKLLSTAVAYYGEFWSRVVQDYSKRGGLDLNILTNAITDEMPLFLKGKVVVPESGKFYDYKDIENYAVNMIKSFKNPLLTRFARIFNAIVVMQMQRRPLLFGTPSVPPRKAMGSLGAFSYDGSMFPTLCSSTSTRPYAATSAKPTYASVLGPEQAPKLTPSPLPSIPTAAPTRKDHQFQELCDEIRTNLYESQFTTAKLLLSCIPTTAHEAWLQRLAQAMAGETIMAQPPLVSPKPYYKRVFRPHFTDPVPLPAAPVITKKPVLHTFTSPCTRHYDIWTDRSLATYADGPHSQADHFGVMPRETRYRKVCRPSSYARPTSLRPTLEKLPCKEDEAPPANSQQTRSLHVFQFATHSNQHAISSRTLLEQDAGMFDYLTRKRLRTPQDTKGYQRTLQQSMFSQLEARLKYGLATTPIEHWDALTSSLYTSWKVCSSIRPSTDRSQPTADNNIQPASYCDYPIGLGLSHFPPKHRLHRRVYRAQRFFDFQRTHQWSIQCAPDLRQHLDTILNVQFVGGTQVR